jgi:hypothetical protein
MIAPALVIDRLFITVVLVYCVVPLVEGRGLPFELVRRPLDTTGQDEADAGARTRASLFRLRLLHLLRLRMRGRGRAMVTLARKKWRRGECVYK